MVYATTNRMKLNLMEISLITFDERNPFYFNVLSYILSGFSMWLFFFSSVFRRSNCIFPNKQNPLEWNENIPSFIYIYAVPNWIESGRSRKMCSLITRIQSTESELRKKAEPYTFFIWFHESQLNSEIDKLLLTHPLIIASTYTYFINSIMDHEKTLKPTTKLNAIVNDTTFNY